MKVHAIVARIINGPIWTKHYEGDTFHFVETLIDVNGNVLNHTFFFKTEMEAIQLKVGDCVLIDTGVDYEN